MIFILIETVLDNYFNDEKSLQQGNSTCNASVAEVAYQLGFEYPQFFSRLFKTKTNQSSLELRVLLINLINVWRLHVSFHALTQAK